MRKRADPNKRGRVPRPLVLRKILRKRTKRTEPSASYETSESNLESAWTSPHRRPEAKVTRNTAYMAKSASEAETKGSQRGPRDGPRLRRSPGGDTKRCSSVLESSTSDPVRPYPRRSQGGNPHWGRVARKAERRTLKGRERETEKKTEKPKGWL